MKDRARSLLPFLAPLLAPFLLLSPLLAGGKVMYWGAPSLQFVPWWNWAWETLRSGCLPLWNPELGMGAPFLANYQTALLYPPNWTYLLLAALGGLPAITWGQALMVALHLAWAGLGMSRLAGRLGMGAAARAVSGLAFGLCGYLVARAGFFSIDSTAAWIPWILSACLGISGLPGEPNPGRERWPSTVKAGVLMGMMLLAGHAQTAWYTLILAGLWTGYWAWQAVERGRWRSLLSAWLRFGLAGLLAVLLAAGQLLPTAEYLGQSQRASAVDYDPAMSYSFWPWHLLSLAAPESFGSPALGDYWGYANYWEDAIYVGLLPFLLAVSAAIGHLRERRRRRNEAPFPPDRRERPASLLAAFFLPLLAVTLLLALGRNTPVFPWLYHHVPTFDMFQAPARLMILAEVGLALLAGAGMDRWRRPQGSALYWTRLGAAGSLSIIIGAGLAWLAMEGINASFIRGAALAGIWALCASLLSLLAPAGEAQEAVGVKVESGWRAKLSQRYPRLFPPGAAKTPGSENRLRRRLHEKFGEDGLRLGWEWAVVGLVTADLIVAGRGLNPGTEPSFYTAANETARALAEQLDGHRLYLPAAHEYYLKFERFLSFESFDSGEEPQAMRAALLPNLSLFEEIASANNFDPLVPGRYASWLKALENANEQVKRQWLNRMDVSIVEKVDLRSKNGYTFTPGGDRPQRLRWAGEAVGAANGEAALDLLLSGAVDPARTVTLEGAAFAGGGGSQAQVTLVSEQADGLTALVEADGDGWLVLSDVWYPGWQALVDGEPTPLLRADYLFRAAAVPAGEHRVEFRYRPLSFSVGLGMSGLAWLLAGLALRRAMGLEMSAAKDGARLEWRQSGE